MAARFIALMTDTEGNRMGLHNIVLTYFSAEKLRLAVSLKIQAQISIAKPSINQYKEVLLPF
jgi:hypothetical protein